MTQRYFSRLFVAALFTAGMGLMTPLFGQAYKAGRTSDGQPNLQGIWEIHGSFDWNLEGHAEKGGVPASKSVIVDPADGKIPYLPAALAKRNAMRPPDDPLAKCYLAGVPRINYVPGPFQIFQTPVLVTIVHQDTHTFRLIPFNRPQTDTYEFWLGSSKGKWDGDTLVIDNVSFIDKTWLDKAGNFHSDELHVVERYTPTGPNTLQYEARLEDPKVYSRPWTMRMIAERHTEPGFRIVEDECLQDDKGKFYHTSALLKK